MNLEDFEAAIENFRDSEIKDRKTNFCFETERNSTIMNKSTQELVEKPKESTQYTLRIQILSALLYLEQFMLTQDKFLHTIVSGRKMLDLIEKIPELDDTSKEFVYSKAKSKGL